MNLHEPEPPQVIRFFLRYELYSYSYLSMHLCLYLSLPAADTHTWTCTNPAREEGTVLELPQVESDEIRSGHEH